VKLPGFLGWLAERAARFFDRRQARKLRALALPSASQAVAGELPGEPPSLPVSIRAPGPLEPPESSRDLWALPLGAAAIRRPGARPALLFRAPSLPPEPALAALQLAAFNLDERGAPRVLARAPSGLLARPPEVSAERLIPALMSPVLFAMRLELGRPELSALRPASMGLDANFSPPPRPSELPAPDASRFAWARPQRPPAAPMPSELRARLPELSVARPASFRLDEEGRTPSERDALESPGDRPPPPAPGRFLRPRTPLARAPLSRLDGTAFRLDPRTGDLPNESIIEARPQPEFPSWYLPEYDRDFYRRWTPFIRLWGLGPLQNEWFSYWWVEFREQKLGPFPPFPFREDREIKWLIILRCKEQMMIRRDVKKLEEPPELGSFGFWEFGVHILAHERQLKLAGLIEKPEWVEVTRVEMDKHEALQPWLDAYSDWRMLLQGLEEA